MNTVEMLMNRYGKLDLDTTDLADFMQKLSRLYDVCGHIEDDLLEFEFYVVCLDRYGNELSRLGYYELEEYYLAHVASTRDLATHPNPCKSV